MSMQQLQNKLSEKYLNIFQYFGYTFIVFKNLVFDINNIWWIFFFIAFNIMDSIIMIILPYYDFPFYHIASPYFRIFYYLFLFLYFKKVIYKIEDNYRLNLGPSVQKFFFLYAIYFILDFVSDFFSSLLLGFLPYEIIVFAFYAILFAIWYKSLYFVPLFMARPFNLKESWNYNLHLSKENKLRIIIPVIIFLGIVIFGYLFVAINTFPLETLDFSGYLIFTFILSFIYTFLSLLFIILNCVIYLNVEYMDRKIS